MNGPRPLKVRLGMLALMLATALALSACGDSHTRVSTGTYAGESGANAPYLNVGPLIYEVQLSRELNPFNSEDTEYLQGLEGAEAKVNPGEEWFGVFLQVYNTTNHELTASNEITIYDTQGNTYTPVVPNQTNHFAYRGGQVLPKNQLPVAGTIPEEVGSAGEVLLFKIQTVSLDNRPIKIRIVDPEAPTHFAQAELDV